MKRGGTLNRNGRQQQRRNWRRRLQLVRDFGRRAERLAQENGMKDTGNSLTLSGTRTGKSYTLIGFDGGQQLREKVYSMGLNSGATFKIISNPGYGPIEVEVRQTRLGIGRGMAAKIKVREVES